MGAPRFGPRFKAGGVVWEFTGEFGRTEAAADKKARRMASKESGCFSAIWARHKETGKVLFPVVHSKGKCPLKMPRKGTRIR